MKAFILAAGLGTRLKPWTETHPKALVPVAGVPMLERVIMRLTEQGFNSITINVHHFSSQIIDFLQGKDFGAEITISDETGNLLDTGGGLLAASTFLGADSRPFLVHNVDILSDAPLADIMAGHVDSGRDVSLVTSPRESSRKLLFNESGNLCGWHNLKTGEYRPEDFIPCANLSERAFSGIYVVNPSMFSVLSGYADRIGSRKFPVMDFLLDSIKKYDIGEIELKRLNLIDIGKPETLLQAQQLLNENGALLYGCGC